MVMLNEEERDVITELMNIGVGQAAASFSEMIGEEVLLSVPNVEIMEREAAAAVLGRLTSDRGTGITQSFEGALVGMAALVFPEAKSLHIVRAVLGNACPVEEITELAQETLLEIGNIILNACLGTISNVLKTEVLSSLPQLTTDVAHDLFSEEENDGQAGAITLFLHIRFQIKREDISGYLVFVMDLPGVERFRTLVASFLQAMG